MDPPTPRAHPHPPAHAAARRRKAGATGGAHARRFDYMVLISAGFFGTKQSGEGGSAGGVATRDGPDRKTKQQGGGTRDPPLAQKKPPPAWGKGGEAGAPSPPYPNTAAALTNEGQKSRVTFCQAFWYRTCAAFCFGPERALFMMGGGQVLGRILFFFGGKGRDGKNTTALPRASQPFFSFSFFFKPHQCAAARRPPSGGTRQFGPARRAAT